MTRCKQLLCLMLALSIFPFPSLHALANAAPHAGKNSGMKANDADDETDDEETGLKFRLSEGAEQATPAQERERLAQTSPLSDAETQNVLRRLPPIKTEASDEQNFALRERSLPPPRTGKVLNASFPPPDQSSDQSPSSALIDNAAAAAAAVARPLEVTHHTPEGEVPLAPQLSVTFSQPMVAVASQGDAIAENLPVRITPQPQGKWRWVGTKTLLFEPDGRFPMATEYRVTIPAGTKSALGGTLAKSSSWSFKTPPLTIKKSYPSGESNRRDALMFIEFDQRIDPSAVLNYISVAAGGENLSTRLATAAEIEADASISELVKAAVKDRWLAFRAVDKASNDTRLALPADTSVVVTLKPGAPSAEGTRTTDKAQVFSFRTYGALRVVEHNCGGDNKECSPFDSWSITFSNRLDTAVFQPSSIRIEPQLSGLKINVYGDSLRIEGVKKARTAYKVTLDKAIADAFGQTLGTDQTITFNVGAATPALSGEGFAVLDPANSPPKISIYSVNYSQLKVSLYSVAPEDWNKYVRYMRYVYNYSDAAKKILAKQGQDTPPGSLVFSKPLEIKSSPDELTETFIDLDPALRNHLGQALVIVEPVTPFNNRERSVLASWVLATNIGLDAFVDHTNLIGWTTSLTNGAPLSGVELSLLPSGDKAASGADGLARLALKPATKDENLNVLVARKGDDVAILPEHFDWYNTSGGWHKKTITDALGWYVFDDRKLYRPGEEVHIKGWIRRITGGTRGDVETLNRAATGVAYTLKDEEDNEITKGALRLNALGGFDASFKLPGTMNLGTAQLELEVQGVDKNIEDREHTHNFQVQEFRRPEFEVSAETSEGTHIVGGHADVNVNAKYYAGGGLPDTEVKWEVTSAPANFTPPNRSDFTFGTWRAWWRDSDSSSDETNTKEFTGRTDASGKHHLRIDFDRVNPPRATTVTAEASVQDVNRQTLNATTTMLVHPADLYVGLRSQRTFVQQGEPLDVEAIVTDLDGKAVANHSIKMRAVLLDWVYEKGEYKQKETNPQECTVVSAGDVVKCVFNPKEGGTYRVTASIMDERERRNESELTLWVAGGKRHQSQRDVKQETIELIPDRKEYKAGDVAELLVQAPFYPAEGVLTLRRSGIVKTKRFRMDAASFTLKIPIEDAYTPNIHAQVDLVGAAVRTDDEGKLKENLPKRPAFASGELNLTVPPLARKLNVQAAPRDKTLEPGAQTIVDVMVRDANNQPVKNSEAAVIVVDESVLALTNYKLGDPLSIFYAEREAEAEDYHSRAKVILANPEDLFARMQNGRSGAGGGTAGKLEASAGVLNSASMQMSVTERQVQDLPVNGRAVGSLELLQKGKDQILLRNNFNALAVFAASVPTNADGRAQVSVKLPDNLTRYRVMAVAVAGGKQFGSGESAITARKPLMVRPSAPRFLNFGDHFELPVVVQNQTDAPVQVNVAVRAGNARLTNGAGRSVTVPANDRVEVRFPVAAERAGTARFQIAAASGRLSDAAKIELPVWKPATTEAFATYGEIDEGAIAQPVKLPNVVVKEFGGLDIETSSTQLQELTDALIYLQNYPYECAEQISSRVMSVAALRDVLTAFKAKDLPAPEAMKAAVARDLKRLQGLQNEDGGFAFWRRDDESWPYISIHVAHALERAKEKGFDVPADMLTESKKYLREIEQRIPSIYNAEARRALIAYALYTRNRLGDKDAARARKLIMEAGGLGHLSLESVGWLLPVLSNDANSQTEVANIRRHLDNRATEEAATAHFASSYSDNDYLLLNSDRRADGVVLEALIGDQPRSELIPKIVRGLLAHRTRGRWENTQENAFVLLALDRYFATYEKATPNMIARAWLGERFAGEQRYKGRTTERQQINVPMRYLAEHAAPQNLVLSKEGAGRLYYRIGMQYAPASLKLNAADYGFAVERVYEAVDDKADVRRDADGVWHIKAGARVRVRLTLVAPTRRYHVALVDPLPAGLEASNPALATTGSIPQDKKTENASPGSNNYYWWWQRSWFEHQNLRDDRAEAFTSLLWEGVYTYSYVARATTPGLFVVPPPKAEEMYHPETFGRGATDRVRIE